MDAKIRVMGHPVHPMLIAFPVAFYTGTLAGYSAYGATADPFWIRFAIALNLAGIGSAALAALPGSIDWLLAVPRRSAASRTGLVHAAYNVIALGLFAWAFVAYMSEWNTPTGISANLAIVLSGAGVFSTILAGFQGWKLVQTHHVGVGLTPEQQRIEPPALRRAG